MNPAAKPDPCVESAGRYVIREARAAADRLGLPPSQGTFAILVSALARAIVDATGPDAPETAVEFSAGLASRQVTAAARGMARGPTWANPAPSVPPRAPVAVAAPAGRAGLDLRLALNRAAGELDLAAECLGALDMRTTASLFAAAAQRARAVLETTTTDLKEAS